MTLTPSERVLRARLASHQSWANTEDRAARTRNGNKALMDSFERQIDPEGKLPDAERIKRAESLKKAHFTRLALKSAQSRRAKKEAQQRKAD